VFCKCPHCAWGRAIHHSLTTWSWESSWADRLATAPYTREFVTESPVLGKVREQFADLEQSSSRSDIFLEACSHLSSECLKRTHRLLIKHHMHMLRVYGHRRWRRSPHQVFASDSQALVSLSCYDTHKHTQKHTNTQTILHTHTRNHARTVLIHIRTHCGTHNI